MRRFILIWLLSATFVALSASVSNAQRALPPQELAKVIVKQKTDLRAVGMRFGAKLSAAFSNPTQEQIDAMRLAYVDVLIAVAKAEEEWRSIAPPDSNPAKELHAEYSRVLIFQRESVQKSALNLIRIVEDKGLSGEEKAKQLNAIIQQNLQTESKDEAILEKLLKAVKQDQKAP